MLSDLLPYFLIFFITGAILGLLYWLHCRQKAKEKEKKVLAFAKHVKLKKSSLLATGFVGLAAAQSSGVEFDDENSFMFDFMNNSLQLMQDNHDELVQTIMNKMSEDQIDSMFDDMKSAFEDIHQNFDFEAFDNRELYDQLNDINDNMTAVAFEEFSAFEHSFESPFESSIDNSFESSLDNSFDDFHH